MHNVSGVAQLEQVYLCIVHLKSRVVFFCHNNRGMPHPFADLKKAHSLLGKKGSE